MTRYSVSLLYQCQKPTQLENYLRVQILLANSREEALGKAIATFAEEMKKLQANLAINVILEISA